jgi:hypothetical protein
MGARGQGTTIGSKLGCDQKCWEALHQVLFVVDIVFCVFLDVSQICILTAF